MFGFDEDSSVEFLEGMGLPKDYTNKTFEQLKKTNYRYIKDLRVNVNNVLESKHYTNRETHLIAVAIAANASNDVLVDIFTKKALAHEATEEEIAEAISCASLLSVNNITYRFRHMMEKEAYNKAPMKVKMNIMMRPVLDKTFFELISLAVSAVNACELCITSHEKSLVDLGYSEEKIWDAIRIAGVITSLSKIVY